MASLEMRGSFDLNTETIDNQVTKISPGNYALGHINKENNHFIVEYVGRADSDVNGKLKQHVGEKYKKFKYSYATSPKAAFQKECRDYHEFGENQKLDNKIHPDKSEDTFWKCPYCDICN